MSDLPTHTDCCDAINSGSHTSQSQTSCCHVNQATTNAPAMPSPDEYDECCGHNHTTDEFYLWQALRLIAIAMPLLLVRLIFQAPLRRTAWGWAEYGVLMPAYLLWIWGVLKTAGRNILRGYIFDENFLMTIATLGVVAIHELPEAIGAMLFYQVGELLQGLAVGRSRRSI